MPRRRRKQLVLVDEDYEQYCREEGYRRLEVALHRQWSSRHSDAPLTEVMASRSVLYKFGNS